MGDITRRFLNVYGPSVTGEYNSDMNCPPASGTPAWEERDMGGRSWARKRGNIRVSGSAIGEISAMPLRAKIFMRQIATCENVFPFHASRDAECRLICMGGI